MSRVTATSAAGDDTAELVRREARPAARFAAGSLVGALLALPFLAVLHSVVTQHAVVARLDRLVATGLNAWAQQRPDVVWVLELLERIASPWSFRLAVLFTAALLWRAGSRHLATWAVTTMAAGGLLGVLLKAIVSRERPVFAEPVASAPSHSFPSGHALNSFLGVGVLLLVLLPALSPRGRVVAWTVGSLTVLITGFDRVGLGVHFVTDVIGAWLLAFALLVGSAVAFGTWRRPAAGLALDRAESQRLLGANAVSGAPPHGDVPALLTELGGRLKALLGSVALVVAIVTGLGLLLAALDDAVWPLTVEEALVQRIADGRTQAWTEISGWLSWISDTNRIEASLVIVALAFRLIFGRWRESAFVVTAVTVQALVFVLASAVVSRPRPDVVQLETLPPTSSYPSGHAGAAFVLYGSIALVLAWHTRQRWLRGVAIAALMVPPLLVACARIYGGMHFPSDIAGSLVNAGLSVVVASRTVLLASLPPQLTDILDRPPQRRSVAVLVYPATLEDTDRLRAMVEDRCLQHGWGPPLWLKTTPEEPGTELTRRAVAAGADLVLCCGGDGTVMAAATGLAGSQVPLALLPRGTGDLLARNLGIPLDMDEALDVAFTGEQRPLDLGRVGDRRFAVMAGLGFDAAMVGDAPPGLKARLGWPAYVISGLRHLREEPMTLELRGENSPDGSFPARTVVVGNVGRLQAGSRLLPDADPGDGMLDVAVVAPRRWRDWISLGTRSLTGSRRDDHLLRRFQTSHLQIRTDRPERFELDGEVGEPVTSMSVDVDPAALLVKVPR